MRLHDKTLNPVLDTAVSALTASVRRNLGEGILLSGGLDTSILACLAVQWGSPECVTVALRGAPAPDIEYAKKVATLFNLKHYIHYFGEEELEEGIRQSIRILKCFDPMEIRNSAAAYIALKTARGRGLASVMTGDGGDELFAGYSFYFELTKKQLETALQQMRNKMRFSTIELGKHLGISVKTPFLDPSLKSYAGSLDCGLKVRAEKGEIFGKWILRKAFESRLPAEIVWRTKAPLEVGTGTTTLPLLYEAGVADLVFNRKKRQYLADDGVKIRSKEHLVYYEIYRKLWGIPRAIPGKGRQCPDCGAAVLQKATYCRTCGAYPI